MRKCQVDAPFATTSQAAELSELLARLQATADVDQRQMASLGQVGSPTGIQATLQLLNHHGQFLHGDIPHKRCRSSKTVIQILPAGPETVPIKRTFFKKMVILPQCPANLMIGNPGKTWRVFRFSASSLQCMRSKQLAVSILVNASPLPSSQRSQRSQQCSNMYVT